MNQKELTKLNKVIWEFGLNLIYLGIKFVQKAFWSLKKPSTINSNTLKEVLKNLGFTEKDMISCSDQKYQIIDWNTWEWIKDIDLIDKLIYYYDYFDCDNFAFLFSSLAAANYQLNSCGVVYGKVYDKNTLKLLGGHAFNVMVTQEGEKTLQNPDGSFRKEPIFRAYCYEPMNDGFTLIERNKSIIIGNWIYHPIWFFFF